MKKAVLLFVMVIVANLCVFAGNYSGGDGATPETAFQIANTGDLIELSNSPDDWGSFFVQTADIVFDPDEALVDWDGDGTLEHPGDDAAGFNPIGNSYTKFSGSYNGQGFAIEGLYINRISTSYVGFFGWVNGINGTSLSDIHLEDVDISGAHYVGGLIGINSAGFISNCSSSGSVYATSNFAGGLVGYSIGACTVIWCSSSSMVTGHSLVGGLFGNFKDPGTITNCYSTGNIFAAEGEAGGLIGNNLGQINSCFASGNVEGSVMLGGLAGINEGGITNCYATGNIEGTIMMGGLAGNNEGIIENCFSKGAISGPYFTGGLVGDNNQGSVINSFWDVETSTKITSSGGTGKSTSEMQSLETFTNTETQGLTTAWDFIGTPNDDSETDDIWNIFNPDINNSYPYMSWQDNSTTPMISSFLGANIGGTSAVLGGIITDDGGSPVTERGVVYSVTDTVPEIGETGVTKDENGSGAGTFSESIGSLQPRSTYYFQAYAINDFGTSYGGVEVFETGYGTVTWKGYEDSDWNNPANWSTEEVPTRDENVVIAFVSENGPDPEINPGVHAECHDIVVETGGSLTIRSNASGAGSLINFGEITCDGNITIERFIPDDKLHLISIPLQGVTANSFFGDYLLRWDETEHQWDDIVDPQQALHATNGYGVQISSVGPKTYSFSGTLLSGPQNQQVTFTEYSTDPDANEGANLLGNPYPSSIDWSGLDDDWGAVYFWNPELEKYATWNNGASTNGGVQYIPPMQGFFIVTSEPGTFSLDNENRTHEGATTFFKDENEINANSILLEARGHNSSDELLIGFNNNTSPGFDLHYDAYKLFSEQSGTSELYAVTGNGKLSIHCLPETQAVQLGFKNTSPGIYSIAIKDVADITEVCIEDTKNNSYHNLLESDLEFIWDPTEDHERRFKLHFKEMENEETPPAPSETIIYTFGKTIFIKGVEKGRMVVTDMIGRKVFTEDFSCAGATSIPVDLEKGIYIVQVIPDSIETQEVTVQNVYIE